MYRTISKMTLTLKVLFIGFFLGFGTVLFFAYYPFHIVDLQKFEVYPTTLKNNEILTIDMNFYKYYNVAGRVDIVYTDTYTYPALSFLGNRRAGQNERKLKIIIPNILPVGKYRLTKTITYNLFGLRQIMYTEESNEFEIVK